MASPSLPHSLNLSLCPPSSLSLPFFLYFSLTLSLLLFLYFSLTLSLLLSHSCSTSLSLFLYFSLTLSLLLSHSFSVSQVVLHPLFLILSFQLLDRGLRDLKHSRTQPHSIVFQDHREHNPCALQSILK